MSHKHKVKIEKIFDHPASGNIDARRVIAALEHYGATVDLTKQHKAKIFMKDQEFILPLGHHSDLSKDTIVSLRHFLEKVDLVPGKIE
jgi:hypothetical protein